jgi:hypothetical protein
MPDEAVYTLRRDRLEDGAETTVYVVRYPRSKVRPRIQVFRQPRRLDYWCAKSRVAEAIVGGFYLRDPFRPLGAVWSAGRNVECEPFPPAYRGTRPALHATDSTTVIRRREQLPDDPEGELLQAGPLLVDEGRIVFDASRDVEGFSAGAGQFDSDITIGRHPRAAIGLGETHLTVLACDGRRSGMDHGLTMFELAGMMHDLDCDVAMNLDGGGSTTLVHCGHLLNRPYTERDQPAPASRPIVTALLLTGS